MSTEIMVIVSFLLVVLGFWGYTRWASYTASAVLEGPAQGAAMVYFERGNVPFRVGRLGAKIHETRAPGQYLEAVTLWRASLTSAGPRVDAPWVAALLTHERGEVQAWLTKEHISPEELATLQAKLEKISPQLSERETAVLEQLTSYEGLMALGEMQEHTLYALFSELHALGANDIGLAEQGIDNWMKPYH